MGNFVVELKNWKMSDINRFRDALVKENYVELAALAGKIIEAWPYEGSADNPDVWENLSVPDFAVAVNAIKLAISRAFDQGN